MLGRFIGLLAGCAMAAVTVLLYDPTMIGPEAPVLAFGDYEVFRPAMVLAAALLALCGFLAVVQPRRKPRKAKDVLETPVERKDAPDSFSLGGNSPSASPLW